MHTIMKVGMHSKEKLQIMSILFTEESVSIMLNLNKNFAIETIYSHFSFVFILAFNLLLFLV